VTKSSKDFITPKGVVVTEMMKKKNPSPSTKTHGKEFAFLEQNKFGADDQIDHVSGSQSKNTSDIGALKTTVIVNIYSVKLCPPPFIIPPSVCELKCSIPGFFQSTKALSIFY
jgi:hypothetical protein